VHQHLERASEGDDALPSEPSDAERELRRIAHATTKKVTEDIEERFHFNTAISALMEMVNAMYTADLESVSAPVLKEALEKLTALLYPMAPHICEELWLRLGHSGSLLLEKWPTYDKSVIQADEMVIVVQVNGKVRSRMTVPADSSDEDLKKAALDDSKVLSHIDAKNVRKIIVVPKKLVNIVAK
jgi:leucyl-tRNA synthetase